MRRLFRHAVLILFHAGFVRPVLRWVAGLRYRRRALLPDGPCLVVSNHNSHLDAAVLMSLFPLRRLPQVHPVAAADYFGATWFMRTLALLLMNGLTIERNPPRGSDPLAPLVAALERGESLVFFPEGSRGEAGVVAPFRTGIGRLVQKLPGLLVVPVFLSGPERIWARGHKVPVPLNIDATVGKPRAYPAQDDPKAIAESVRDDVLALAPPPPPVPGPSPRRPSRVAVCGIDAAARTELFLALTERLAREAPTLGVADAGLVEADPAGIRELSAPPPIAPASPWLGLLARTFRIGGMVERERFVALVDRAHTDEALSHDVRHRFLVTDGNPLVDLLAWAEARDGDLHDAGGLHRIAQHLAGELPIPFRRWWSFVRHTPEVWLVNVFDLARPPVPHVLVVAHVPVALALERIRARGKRLAAHENAERLERLQRAYAQVAGVLEKRRRVVYVKADVETRSPSEVAQRVAEACARLGEGEVVLGTSDALDFERPSAPGGGVRS